MNFNIILNYDGEFESTLSIDNDSPMLRHKHRVKIITGKAVSTEQLKTMIHDDIDALISELKSTKNAVNEILDRQEENNLIAKQSKHISGMEESTSNAVKNLGRIDNILHGIGGPLNDNKMQYTPDQLKTFREISEMINDSLEEIKLFNA